MDKVQPVMGRGDGDDPPAGGPFGDAKAFVEMLHEGRHAVGGGRQVPPHGDLTIARLPHPARNDGFLCAVGVVDHTEFVGHFVVKGAVHPCEEFDRGRRGHGAIAVHLVDGALHDDMGPRLKREGRVSASSSAPASARAMSRGRVL